MSRDNPTPANQLRIACAVRTVGERTTELCAELIGQQLGQEPTLISVPVHREMVRRCFELALEQDADVLITVDADVLPYQGGVLELLRLHQKVPSHTFVIVPRIDDHLLGKERVGGLRLYRVSLLRQALELLPTSSKVRPESSLMMPMAAVKHPSVMAASVCGLHDAEQYLVDVHRKAGFYCHRNVKLVPDMLTRWRDTAVEHDPDEFNAALLGLAHGVKTLQRGPDFVEHDPRTIIAELADVGIQERPPLDSAARSRVAARLPEARISDRWWTYPTPRSMAGQLAEARRLRNPLWKAAARRILRSAARAIEGRDSVEVSPPQ